MTTNEDYMRDYDEEHAECSPSQLEANMLCHGRRRMRKLKPQKTNPYAEEGTMLHNCIECKIQREYFANPVKYAEGYLELDNEQTIAIEDCYEYFCNVVAEIEKTHDIIAFGFEVPTSLEWANIPEVSGHVDVRILSRFKHTDDPSRIDRLDVIDWKFGQGIYVTYTKNPQTRAYAAGSVPDGKALERITDIYTHICQPRLDNMGADKISGKELTNWVYTEVVPAVEATRNPEAPCTPGEKQCKFCVGPTCAARYAEANALATEVFARYVPGKIKDFVGIDDLIPLYEKAALLDLFIKDIAKELFDNCYNTPDGVPGYKVVEGRSNRTWKDEKAAEEFLIKMADDPESGFTFEDIFKNKMVTVAQAEKLARGLKTNEEFKKLWDKPPGKLTLAPEDDPRDAVKNDAETVFAKFVGKE